MKYIIKNIGIVALCTTSMGIFAAIISDVPEKTQVNDMIAPMVVEFYSPSCPHCNQMAPIYTKVAQKCGERVHFYKVNITTPQGMSSANQIAHENISGIPTFVFVNKAGERTVKTGGMNENDLKTTIDKLCK